MKNTLFNHTIYINLKKRPERKKEALEELKKIGITQTLQTTHPTAIHLEAIEEENGAIGCTKSHIKCLEIAIANDWEQVFICEDDIVFTQPELFLQQLQKFIDNPPNPDWDLLMVTGNNNDRYDKIENVDYCVKLTGFCQTTAGYIVRKHYYNRLLENYKQGLEKFEKNPNEDKLYSIDQQWKSLQSNDNWYFIMPPTIVQRPGYSDILKIPTDYRYVLSNFT